MTGEKVTIFLTQEEKSILNGICDTYLYYVSSLGTRPIRDQRVVAATDLAKRIMEANQ
jgi:hypothetical protein